jgi:hypothetical protein
MSLPLWTLLPFALWARAAQPASPLPELDARAEQGVRAFCKDSPEYCAGAEGKLSAARYYVQECERCLKGCSLSEIDRVSGTRDVTLSVIRDYEDNYAKGGLGGLWALVDAADARLRPKAAALIAELERETSSLEAAPGGAASGRVRALGERGLKAFESFRSLSSSVDNTLWNVNPDAVPLRERANLIAVRLAGLRDRLRALQARSREPLSESLDLSEAVKFPAPGKDIRKGGIGSSLRIKKLEAAEASPAVSADASPDGRPIPSQGIAPRRTLLDLPDAVPPLAKKPAPDILPKSDALTLAWKTAASQVLRFMISPLIPSPDWTDKAQADLLRRMGLTETIGNPGAWADLAHRQGRGNCAVVTQQQVLQAYGLVRGDPSAVERELTGEAQSKGYFKVNYADPSSPPKDEGSPRQYMGNLLQDRGFLVSKHARAEAQALNAAVLRGRPVGVSVDPGILWDDETAKGYRHSVLVTGAEKGRNSGFILGYYVNDSGSLDPARDHFIPSWQFLRAFVSAGSSFFEIN